MNDRQRIASNVKAARVRAGFKSKDMASQLSINKGYYSELENGHKRLDVERLLEIADILRIDPAELLYRKVRYCPTCGHVMEAVQ